MHSSPRKLGFSTSLRMLSAALVLALVPACTKQPVPAGAGAAPTVSQAALDRLAAADAVDGKTDKVVSKCAGCSLHMDGKAELALKVQDYTMDFCSQKCLDRFTAAPEKEILALKVAK